MGTTIDLQRLKYNIWSCTGGVIRQFYVFFRDREWRAVRDFLNREDITLHRAERKRLVRRLNRTSCRVNSPHSQTEMLKIIGEMLALPPSVAGCFVEAGCFKGSSTSKFSLAAAIMGRRLVVFDSFEGIPENEEDHGWSSGLQFPEGSYAGALEEVKANIEKHGNLDCCEFKKGWFDDTMPSFSEPVAIVYVDVDLASSTRTCVKYLYPLLSKGGVFFSQDGHLPLVVDVFADDAFWASEVGCSRPTIEGLGSEKLITIRKSREED